MVGWLSGWTKRKRITITGSTAGAQTNFQMKVDVVYDGNMQADFDDLRFTSSDGTTLINFWLESKTNSDSAVVWVKVPSIPASPSTIDIYMYYGNSSAVSASDGANTFIFFENFESGSAPGWTLGTDFTVVSVGYSSTYSLRSGYTGQAFSSKAFTDVDYLTVFECNVRQNSGSEYGLYSNAEIYFIGVAGVIAYIRFGYPVSGKWGVNNDSLNDNIDTGYAYSEDVWYNIKFEQTELGKTNIYVRPDGEAETEVYHQKVSGNNYCGKFMLYSGKVGGSPYTNFDNLRVRKFVSPEPTYSFSPPLRVSRTIFSHRIGTRILPT